MKSSEARPIKYTSFSEVTAPEVHKFKYYNYGWCHYNNYYQRLAVIIIPTTRSENVEIKKRIRFLKIKFRILKITYVIDVIMTLANIDTILVVQI